jgi:hypothetical protein
MIKSILKSNTLKYLRFSTKPVNNSQFLNKLLPLNARFGTRMLCLFSRFN